jgi:hypothetical protein
MSPIPQKQDYSIPFASIRTLIAMFAENVTAFKLTDGALCNLDMLAAFLVMIAVFYDTTPCRLVILLRLL